MFEPTAQMALEPENILSLTGTSKQPRDYVARRNQEEYILGCYQQQQREDPVLGLRHANLRRS